MKDGELLGILGEGRDYLMKSLSGRLRERGDLYCNGMPYDREYFNQFGAFLHDYSLMGY